MYYVISISHSSLAMNRYCYIIRLDLLNHVAHITRLPIIYYLLSNQRCALRIDIAKQYGLRIVITFFHYERC